MKAVKVFTENDYTEFYFVGYTNEEIVEYVRKRMPKHSYCINVFKDSKTWNKHWKILEMMNKKTPPK